MRRVAAGILVAVGVAALPQAAAGLLVWTFVVLPLTVTAGQGTVFTMTASNVAGPNDLGCMEVTLPASFTIQSVADPTASNGDDWAATLTGTTVEVRSLSGGGRLHIGESVTFQVKATASTAGITSWPNHAHRQHDCGGATELGLPVEVVVVPPVLPTATPQPTPKPKPVPTAHPTPRPSPIPSLPVSLPPLPSLGIVPTPQPTPAPSDREPLPARPTQTAVASAPTSAESASLSASPTATPATAAAPPSSRAPRVPPDPATVRLDGGTLTVFDGFETWSVPAAVVGVPGLLVVLWVALQTVGALAWIPVVHRFRREDGARRPPGARQAIRRR